MQTVIETKSLCKQYGTRMAVDHVELHVPQGCVYGFIGPNGAGKSTTMKMLLGLIHPTSGSVRLLGQPLTRESRLALLRQTGSLIENPANSRPQTRYKIYTNTCVKHISFTTTKNFARNKSNGRTGTAIIKFQLCPICSSRHR